MREIIYDIENEELIRDRINLRQVKDNLYKLKEEYMIDNYNKPKDELLIINEVLNNFIDCIGKK